MSTQTPNNPSTAPADVRPSPAIVRMRGTIEGVRPTFGFIRGDDGVSRFFLPSGLQVTPGVRFEDLRVGMRADFVHLAHPRGPRAIEILILLTGEGR